jgi:hypothetical protein
MIGDYLIRNYEQLEIRYFMHNALALTRIIK